MRPPRFRRSAEFDKHAHMRTIGLTGGIGTGKSAVSAILAELGAEVINADRVGHDVYRPGTVGWKRVTKAFGTSILAADGSIDRGALGALVFGNPAALARLNAIVHPLIAGTIRRLIEQRRAAGSEQPIVVEAAVLIEANWIPLVDEVWVVTAPPETVIERVRAERGLTPEQITARMSAQLSDAERRLHADVIIENAGSREALRARVAAAWAEGAAR